MRTTWSLSCLEELRMPPREGEGGLGLREGIYTISEQKALRARPWFTFSYPLLHDQLRCRSGDSISLVLEGR